jgi:hypothetical protein
VDMYCYGAEYEKPWLIHNKHHFATIFFHYYS